jgi:hypothetical protein
VLGVGGDPPAAGREPEERPTTEQAHVLAHRIRRAQRRGQSLGQRRRGGTLRAREAGEQRVREERDPGEQQEIPDERRQQGGEQERDERLRANFEPSTVLQEWLGHADSKTTQIYTHYAPDEHEVQMVNDGFAPPAAEEEEKEPSPLSDIAK